MITLGPEKSIYSVLLPEVNNVLNFTTNVCYQHINDQKILDKLRTDVIDKFKLWVNDIVDLSEFNYCYCVNGVTNAIDQWLMDNTNNILIQPGEYGWLKIQRPWLGSDHKPYETAYISNPFSSHGCFHKNHESITLPTLLDCAFIGSTAKKRINITPNIQAIAFSLSKGFGLNLFRTGFLFSRTPIPALEIWIKYNYFNLPGLLVTKKIIENFTVDYIYNKFVNVQREICIENNFKPSDCVFLATTTDVKYEHYKRSDGNIRICLSREFVRRGYGSLSYSDLLN